MSLKSEVLGAGHCCSDCCASTRPTSTIIRANVTLIAGKMKLVSKYETPVKLAVIEAFEMISD